MLDQWLNNMITLNTGDWHAPERRPENRIDDYWNTFLRKVDFIMETAEKYKAEFIIQPADLTDTPALSYENYIELGKKIKKKIYTTWGQHDLRFRNKKNTVLKALDAFSEVEILTNEYDIIYNGVCIKGCPYNDEIPSPTEGEFNILIIHKMLVEDKLWAEQKEFEWGSSFLRRNKFDLIISGDNHQFFMEQIGNRFLFNCGSLMRSSIAQIDHEPKIVIFDTDSRNYEIIKVPIQPAAKVFMLDKVEKEKEKNEKIEAFVSGLSEQKEMSLSFMDNLYAYAKENNIEKEIVDVIVECSHD